MVSTLSASTDSKVNVKSIKSVIDVSTLAGKNIIFMTKCAEASTRLDLSKIGIMATVLLDQIYDCDDLNEDTQHNWLSVVYNKWQATIDRIVADNDRLMNSF